MSLKQLKDIKELLREYGIKCIGIGAYSNVMKKRVANLLKSIDLAVEFGCKYVITAMGDAHNDADVFEDETVLYILSVLKAIETSLENGSKVRVLFF